MSLYKDIKIPLKLIYDGDRFLLVDLALLFEYINGRRTETQIGFRGTFVDMISYDKFTVKILNLKPQITPDILKSSHEKIFVRLVDAFAKPYVQNGHIAYSISAKDLEIVKKPATPAAERM